MALSFGRGPVSFLRFGQMAHIAPSRVGEDGLLLFQSAPTGLAPSPGHSNGLAGLLADRPPGLFLVSSSAH